MIKVLGNTKAGLVRLLYGVSDFDKNWSACEQRKIKGMSNFTCVFSCT